MIEKSPYFTENINFESRTLIQVYSQSTDSINTLMQKTCQKVFCHLFCIYSGEQKETQSGEILPHGFSFILAFSDLARSLA